MTCPGAGDEKAALGPRAGAAAGAACAVRLNLHFNKLNRPQHCTELNDQRVAKSDSENENKRSRILSDRSNKS
ncbi:hypothetical protein EVAR_40715_1 [Eumeta japonica]|uniref:Uncharacterized protein n=1 Tax=Eumeta variegata TaxID=151549 RepID=A0A4C1XAH8_EUMVA|nr:hypothetical protein EVAR_40715_1 [Eumeta japonica]